MGQRSIDVNKFNGALPDPEPALSKKLDGEFGADKPELPWLNFEDFEQLPDEEPQLVIEGLLHIGEKLGITAGSKSFKTWLLLYLGFCIANGIDFLGFKTTKSKVVFFDLELSRWGLKRRLRKIQKALGKGTTENLKVCSLRGKASLFCANLPEIQKRIVHEGFKVVIIDPVYKFLLGKEENSNGVVADILEKLTVFCMEAAVALIYVHHHSKGNQAEKSSLDRSSGAGAWSRDPDAVLDLVEHEESTKEERIYSAEITVREFPPVEKFVVRWQFPLLVRDKDELDPEKLKQPAKGGRPKGDADEKILVALRTAEVVCGRSGLSVQNIEKVTGVARRTIYRSIERCPKHIVKSPLVKGYQLSVEERKKFPTNDDEED